MLADRFRVAEQKARRHDLARRLRAAVEDEVPTEELRQQFEAMRYTPPVAKRYLVNDTTVEKLGELLNHHPNGLLLFRDELSGWLHTMDRPGHENDRAFYCEAWNGTSAYTYDRIGARDPAHSGRLPLGARGDPAGPARALPARGLCRARK